MHGSLLGSKRTRAFEGGGVCVGAGRQREEKMQRYQDEHCSRRIEETRLSIIACTSSNFVLRFEVVGLSSLRTQS